MMAPPTRIVRHLEEVLVARLLEEPVVVLNGARTVGKSTLLRACARSHGVPVLDLDDPETREAVARDPSRFVLGNDLTCIDEFQHVLPVLDAIKAQLNRDLRPGRYVLTGSTRYATLPATSQSLAGRAHVMTVWPFAQGELRGVRESFLDTLFLDPGRMLARQPSGTSREQYEMLVLAGGFPLALSRSTDAARRRWFADFLNLVITRDALGIRTVRQRRVLPVILRRLAAQTAQLLKISAVAESVELDRTTVSDLVELLETVFLVHRLDAFGRTLSARMNRTPKVHVVDSGLGAYLLRITPSRLAARDPSTLTEFGHLIETFAVNELIKQAGWADIPCTFSHFRTPDGQEVDLVIETDDGRIAGVEVKAAGSVRSEDFRGLRLLRDRMGADFVGGVVLSLGDRAYTFEDRLHVLPLDSLWA